MPAGPVVPSKQLDIDDDSTRSREKATGGPFGYAVAAFGKVPRHTNIGPGADHHREAFIGV
jgi:hypothetical protein